jgi:hypothetical protein
MKMTGADNGHDDDQAFRQPAKSDLLDLRVCLGG